jgi:HSP20 family protein
MLPVLKKRMYFPQFRDDYFGSEFLNSLFSDGADYRVPAVNIKENENQFEIELAAPGINKEDLKINLEKNILTISSEKESKKESDDKTFMRREFGFNSFCRSFSIPEFVNTESIQASLKNGVLIVELPKHTEEKLKSSKAIKIS